MSKKMSFTYSNDKFSVLSSFKRNKSNNSNIYNNNLKYSHNRTKSSPITDKINIYIYGNLNTFHKISKNNFYKILTENDIMENVVVGEYNTYFINNKKLVYEIESYRNSSISLKQWEISQKKQIKKISLGCDFTFILTKNDEIYSWGKNYKGQLGLGNYNNYEEPKLVHSISLNNNGNKYYFDEKKKNILNDSEFIVDISCGSCHTLAYSNFNRLFSCGFGETFALGHGNNTTLNEFSEISYLNKLDLLEDKIKKISTGVSHSACLIGNRLYIWGIHINRKNLINKTPILFELPENSPIIDIYLGDLLTVILNNKGNVFVWGNNQYGQLANENLNLIYSNFIKIKLPYQVEVLNCGANHVICINNKKKHYVGWGSNFYGQLNPYDINKYYCMPTELKWLKDIKPYKFVCGKYSTCLFSLNPVINKENLLDKYKEELKIIKEKYGSIENKCLLYKEENKNLKCEIKALNKTIKHMENSYNNSDVKISDLEDSNDVMKMFKKELKNGKTIKPQFEIDFKEVKLEKKISEGGFGLIYKAKWRETFVAVKILKTDLLKEDTIKDFLYEIKAMESLRHPNIVLFLGQCTKLPNLCIVLEYCSRKSLWSLLQKKEIKLEWHDKRMMALEIAKGMNYLHNFEPPILHRDLKSLNILIDDGYRPKIADFGWTRFKDKDMTGKIGTFQWMAPEVIQSLPYTEKADVFSFGIILWEFASREPPFKDINGPDVAMKVLKKNLRPDIPSNTPKKFKELMVKCWDQNPKKRPYFKTIIDDLRNMTFE